MVKRIFKPACALSAAWLGLIAPMAAQAQDAAPAMGREFAGVNGTTIQCPLPVPPSAEQMASQFETRPRDLDKLSEQAAKFFNSNSAMGAEFRARQAEQRASDWPFLCRYRDANADLLASGQHPEVVFMGDSITEGWIQADPAFFTANHYADRGISGQSSSQMVARFQQDVVALKPRAVHIIAGTNDIGGATGAITEDEFVANMRAMLDMAKANDIAVVLGAIPPMSRLLPRPDFDVRPVVRRLNERLALLAQERGVELVDYYTPMALPDGSFNPRLANDGVHPTRAGYAVMQPLADAAIARTLEKTRR